MFHYYASISELGYCKRSFWVCAAFKHALPASHLHSLKSLTHKLVARDQVAQQNLLSRTQINVETRLLLDGYAHYCAECPSENGKGIVVAACALHLVGVYTENAVYRAQTVSMSL